MANAYISTATVSAVVQNAYDRYLEFQLRAMPVFRPVVDKRPVQQDKPGPAVVFSFYQDLTVATTPLTETVDPDAVALGNPTQVTATLNEYGNATLTTIKVEQLALTDIDEGAANIVAFNCVDSIDTLVQNTLATSTNTLTNVGGTFVFAPGANENTVATTTLIDSKVCRFVAAKLRANKVVPRTGTLYQAVIHPEVSVDLRAESGAGAWRDSHIYAAPDVNWSGQIGTYEGINWAESPRCQNTPTGASSARVFYTYFLGQQCLAEAVAIEPHMVVGPVVDKLNRHRPLGWHALIGWALYRTSAMILYKSSASIHST